MRPNRIIVGEVRAEEASTCCWRSTPGCPGMASIHANSAKQALVKLCTLPLLAGENVSAGFVVPTVATAVDIVVHTAIDAAGRRAVREIVATTGRAENGIIEAEPIFVRRGGRLERGPGTPAAPRGVRGRRASIRRRCGNADRARVRHRPAAGRRQLARRGRRARHGRRGRGGSEALLERAGMPDVAPRDPRGRGRRRRRRGGGRRRHAHRRAGGGSAGRASPADGCRSRSSACAGGPAPARARRGLARRRRPPRVGGARGTVAAGGADPAGRARARASCASRSPSSVATTRRRDGSPRASTC